MTATVHSALTIMCVLTSYRFPLRRFVPPRQQSQRPSRSQPRPTRPFNTTEPAGPQCWPQPASRDLVQPGHVAGTLSPDPETGLLRRLPNTCSQLLHQNTWKACFGTMQSSHVFVYHAKCHCTGHSLTNSVCLCCQYGMGNTLIFYLT